MELGKAEIGPSGRPPAGNRGTADVGAAEPFINKAEAARRLSCGLRTLEEWMYRGIVPYYKVSKRVMFRWSEVQAVLAATCRVAR